MLTTVILKSDHRHFGQLLSVRASNPCLTIVPPPFTLLLPSTSPFIFICSPIFFSFHLHFCYIFSLQAHFYVIRHTNSEWLKLFTLLLKNRWHNLYEIFGFFGQIDQSYWYFCIKFLVVVVAWIENTFNLPKCLLFRHWRNTSFF